MDMTQRILKVYALALLLGVCVGVVGSGFQLVIFKISYWLAFLPIPLSILISTLMVILAWFLVQTMAPEAAGSGIQEIEGALLHERPINWRYLLPVKFIGGVLAICAKLVVGREGPTIQMGGNLGAMLAEWFKVSSNRKDTLVAAGAAAGLATAFNAPFAGILFVIEELRNAFNFNFTNFKMVALACVTATIITQLMMGPQPAIPMAVFATPRISDLGLFFVFGIIAGFGGLLFNKVLMNRLYFSDKLSSRWRFLYVMAIGLLVGVLAVYAPKLVGGGYEIIQQSLTFSPPVITLLIILIARFITTILCYSTSVPGGIFAPLLALGTLLGLVCFHFFSLLFPSVDMHPGMFAVAGMGALFSACIRSPLTGIILVVEMTQNYLLILPLMVCCLTSTTVVQLAKNAPIYTQLLRRTLKNVRS